MAKVFLTNINLKGNQLLNAALQPASSAPNASGAGQVYYNTNTQALYFSTGSGTGNWQQLAAGTTSVASLNNETGAITLQGTADYITVDTTGSTITINIDTKVATTDGTQTLENKTLLEPTLKGRISLTDGNDNETAYIEHSYTGTTRITATDDLALRSTDGDIILYPGNDNGGPGKAYIHWGDDSSGSYPQREIATIGTSQIFTNKTIGDQLTFNDGSNDSSIDVDGNDLYVNANNNLTLSTANGNIVINPDGYAYLNNSSSSNNRIATLGDLNSNAVVQSVTGTLNEVEVSDDGNGNVTVGLPNDVTITDTFSVGSTGAVFAANATTDTVSVNGQLNLSDAGGFTTSSVFTDGNNDLTISAFNNLVLQHDSSGVFIGNTNQGNEVVTEAGSATLTNKNIGDELTFTNPSTFATDGGIVINDGNEHFEIKAYTSDLDITSTNGDITLNPDGQVIVNSNLDVSGNIFTPQIYGRGANGGNLTLSDSHSQSQIHIDDTSKDIELLPYGSGKAFYGSAATAGNEIAKISDIQASSSGLSWKQAVHLFASSNISLTGDATTTSVDGHSLSTANSYRILLTNQSTPTENGIYDIAVSSGTYTLTRSSDADNVTELIGAALFVMEGTTYGSTSWVQSNHYSNTYDDLTWVQFSGQGTYTGSNSIYLDGNSINVVADGDRGLNIDGDGTYVKIGDGIQFVGGNVSINPGTGFDTTSGALEFASGYGVRKYTDEITGDNSTDSFAITHNLGTRDVTVQIYQSSGTPDTQWQDVEADIVRTSTNAVTISFASAPTNTTTYNVVIVG